jgi:hypothetical protein
VRDLLPELQQNGLHRVAAAVSYEQRRRASRGKRERSVDGTVLDHSASDGKVCHRVHAEQRGCAQPGDYGRWCSDGDRQVMGRRLPECGRITGEERDYHRDQPDHGKYQRAVRAATPASGLLGRRRRGWLRRARRAASPHDCRPLPSRSLTRDRLRCIPPSLSADRVISRHLIVVIRSSHLGTGRRRQLSSSAVECVGHIAR